MAVTLNDKYLKGVVNADELKGMEPMVKVAHEMKQERLRKRLFRLGRSSRKL